MKINRAPNRLEKMIMRIVQKEAKPRMSSLWGQKCKISPAYVQQKRGDGLQVVYLQPIDTRPDYYVLRIDSSEDVEAHNFDWDGLICMAEEAFDSYSSYRWDWIGDKWMGIYQGGDDDEKPIVYQWPMVKWLCGGSWGVIKNFKPENVKAV